MAAKQGWNAFKHFVRVFRPTSGSLGHGVRTMRTQYRGARWLLTLPTGALLPALSFFKTKQDPEMAPAANGESELQRVTTEADALYDSRNIDEVLKVLAAFPQPDTDEILWRRARAMNEKSKLIDDKKEQKRLVFEAYELVKRALELNDKNFACHKWYAILMDKTAEYEGTKARISNAYVVKEHFMKATELNPKDATTLYTLGVWCFLFADMPWYQRKIAGALFASPPTSTYDEALQFFQKAEETEPNFFSKNTMMLGKTYLRMGDKKMAMVHLTRAREFPLVTPDDKEAHKEATDLLTKMGVKLDK